MSYDTALALACLGMTVWEGRRLRGSHEGTRLWFLLFLTGAVVFTVFAVRAFFGGRP